MSSEPAAREPVTTARPLAWILGTLVLLPGLAALGWVAREAYRVETLRAEQAAVLAGAEDAEPGRRLAEDLRYEQALLTVSIDVIAELKQAQCGPTGWWSRAISVLEPEEACGPLRLACAEAAVELTRPGAERERLEARAAALRQHPDVAVAEVLDTPTDHVALRVVPSDPRKGRGARP